MEDRKYVIFDISEIDKVDFSKVMESSTATLRTSYDETKTFVKFNSEEIPAFIETLTTKGEILSHSEILTVLNTPEWSKPEPIKNI